MQQERLSPMSELRPRKLSEIPNRPRSSPKRNAHKPMDDEFKMLKSKGKQLVPPFVTPQILVDCFYYIEKQGSFALKN